MILDVPTSDELTQAGTNLLNLTWATEPPKCLHEIRREAVETRVTCGHLPYDVSPCQATTVGCARSVAVNRLGTWTMQHRFRECDFCHR